MLVDGRVARTLVLLVLAGPGIASCGSAVQINESGSGGTPNASGGSVGSGGSSASGGTTATGGSSSGGSVGSSGGIKGGSGGAASGSGGSSSSSGGMSGGSGGNTGTGGSGTAGTGSGGATGGRAGQAGRGGSMTGTGGSGMGSAGMSGGTGAGGTTPSAGCGKAPPASMRYSIDVSGMAREYILYVPPNYDMNHPYRLIFAWHPLGGNAMQTAGTGSSGYYGLQGASKGDAILVSPEGLPFSGSNLGWGNKNGGDIDFLKAMLAKFKGDMCIDESRIFSTGFSFGGMFSYAVGCAGLARAIAPMAGNTVVSGCTNGTQPVAMMGFHGTHDSVVDISGGRTGRDVFVKRNQCSMDTTSPMPSWCDGLDSKYQPCMCVSYNGCMAGYPVTWCEYNADHQPAPNSGPTIWSFFSQF